MADPTHPPFELDPDALKAYVIGSLSLRAAAHEDLPVRVGRALGWYRELLGRGAARGVPFSWVYDLGWLLVEGDRFPFRSPTELQSWDPAEREVRLEYENRVLNALLRDPSVRRAVEAVARDPHRDDLIARGVEFLLRPLVKAGGHAGAPVVDPLLLRELAPSAAQDPDELGRRYDEAAQAVPGGVTLLGALRSALDRYASRRGGEAAMGADDLTELEHWSAFRRAAQRLAGRRIGARAASLPPIDPTGVAIREDDEAETELPDSGYYPSGGYTELSNRGALENLVPTELVFLGEDPFGDDPEPIVDMFALRHLEAETLFFQRDSGQLRRVRRTVHVAVAPEEGLRLQLRWHQDPLVVLVYGLVVRLCEDLTRLFPGDALRVELHLVCGSEAARDRAREDRELLQVLLRHEIARGAAAVHVDGPELDLRTLGERARRTYGIAVQSGDRPPAGLPVTPPARLPEGVRPPRLVVWRIGGPPPAEDASPPVVHLPVEGAPDRPLLLARDALLVTVVGAKR